MIFLLIKERFCFCWIEFNKPCRVFADSVIFSRSVFKVSVVLGLSTTRKRLVSSAKSLMLDPISLTMSFKFIYSRNKRGPRIEPCGTPACM